MDWIGMAQISLSIGTFGMLVYEVFYNSRQRKIDRRISVTVEDQREKQRKLFDNVNGLLDIEKKFIYSKITEDELSSILLESLSYKVGVWININRKNKFAERLRDNCTSLATWLASSAESRIMGNNNNYLESAHRNVMDIWILVDKYIEEEENLIEYLLKSKEISGYLIKSNHFICSFCNICFFIRSREVRKGRIAE